MWLGPVVQHLQLRASSLDFQQLTLGQEKSPDLQL